MAAIGGLSINNPLALGPAPAHTASPANNMPIPGITFGASQPLNFGAALASGGLQLDKTTPQSTQADNNYPTSPTGTLAPTGTSSPDYSAFKGLYDTEIGNLQNQYNALPAYQHAAAANIGLQYTPQYNTLQTQHAGGLANLDLAQSQLDTSRSQGLRNLGNSLRSALNGYQNQIGVMGAGNSSAAPMIGYALSQQGNREMGDMNTQYNQQQTGINQQRDDLEAGYKNQLDSLNAWKQANLNQIAQQYAQQQSYLQNQIMGAQGDEARYLALYGQTALANQTIQQMKDLENQYSNQVGQLNSHFQQVSAPVADISKYSGPYNIQAITPGQLTPLSFAANQDTSSAPSAIASLTRKPDQSPNSNLGF